MRYNVIRIDDFNVVRYDDITRPNNTFAFLAQLKNHFFAIVQLEDYAFQVQKNINDIFLNAIDRGAILETVRTGASGVGRGERILRV